MNKIQLISTQAKLLKDKNLEITPGLKMIGVSNMWEEGIQGDGIVVAVIDTGCQTDHPDLINNIIGEKNFTSTHPDDQDNYEDGGFHGTHVSGTIAASMNGTGVGGVALKQNYSF
jgi:major intracellular serine protease